MIKDIETIKLDLSPTENKFEFLKQVFFEFEEKRQEYLKLKDMKQAIWRINDKNGIYLGLLVVESYLDIIDVRLRAKIVYGEDSDFDNPVFMGATC